MLLRSVIFLIVYALFHQGLLQAQVFWSGDSVVFGWFLACLDLPRTTLSWVMGEHFMSLHTQSMGYSSMFFWLMFWLWLHYDPVRPSLVLFREPVDNRVHPIFADLSLGFRIRSAIGLFVLSHHEQEVFRCTYIALPESLRRPFKDQWGRLTRSQRQYLNTESSRAITSFQSVRFLTQAGRFPLKFPQHTRNEDYVLATCMLVKDEKSVQVQVFVSNGVIARLEYTSDYSLRTFPRFMSVYDVRVHEAAIAPTGRVRRRTVNVHA